MANTTNLNLIKLNGTEKLKTYPTSFNGNMDTIDGAVGNEISTTRTVTQAISKAEAGIAIVANGNTHSAIASGQYVYVKKHGSLTEGLYKATTAISTNATLSGSNLTAVSGGGLNDVYSTLNNNITNKLVFKACHSTPADANNSIYDTGVKQSEYICVSAFTPFDSNMEIRISNTTGNNGTFRFTIWDVVSNTKIVNGYNYWVYCVFLSRSGLKEIT